MMNMKRKFLLAWGLLGAIVMASAQDNDPAKTGVIALSPEETYPASSMVSVVKLQEKAIYIPKDLRGMDLNSDTAKWSFKRMVSTPDVVLFWEKGFGPDITKAPDLDGHNMKVDLANLMSRLQSYYDYFYKDLAFVKPGTNAEKYKMMVMLEYSLRGVAMGGDYDGVIGALWVTPNRLQDEKLNCIAHELGHLSLIHI